MASSSTAGIPAGYSVLKTLGAGAFGKVFLVAHAEASQPCALKRLERVDSASVYRFKQEFRALADLTHPNLVRLHDLYFIEDSWCFTMDYIEGVRFDTWVRGLSRDRRSSSADTTRSDGTDEETLQNATSGAPPSSRHDVAGYPFDEIQLRAALRQLVDGVLALHGAGILHRDLKPSNVLVTATGRVVILDFGLAVVAVDGPPQSSDGRLGTPAYMSPEQVRGGGLTMASDWYAVGVMLYEALSGQLPFGGSVTDMLTARLNRDPRPVSAICPAAPKDLADLTMALLDRNPTARPGGFQMAQRLGLDPVSADSPRHVLGGAFVGRSVQLAALSQAFEETRAGKTVVAHVYGPSGYGKTTLVRRFLGGLALEREVVVLEGRCYERESMPFKALDDLVDALGRYLKTLPVVEAAALLPRDSRALVRLFPALGRLDFMTSLPGRAASKDPQELRRRGYRALRDMFARLTDSRPVVLFIDDVHWGDSDSAQLVRNLLAPPDVPPLLLIVGYRGEAAESNELLRTLRTPVAADSEWQTVDVPLGPLNEDETRELASSLIGEGQDADARLSRIAGESGGSPLFVSELARFAVTHSEHPQAISLSAVVEHRVKKLPVSAQRVLHLIACMERPVSDQVLSEASGVEDKELRLLLEELRDERLITNPLGAHAAETEMLHDKLRTAVRATLKPAQLAAYHAALAAALEGSGAADLESIAYHCASAGMQERARTWLEAAGDRASLNLALNRAVHLYQEACPSVAGEARIRVQRKLADALVSAGRGPEAALVLLELASLTDSPLERRALRRRAAEQYLWAGHVEEGLSKFQPLLEAAHLPWPKTPGSALMSLLYNRTRLKLRGLNFKERAASEVPPEALQRIDDSWVLGAGLSGIDLVRSAHYHSLSLLLALQAGEPSRISRGLAMHGVLKALESNESIPAARAHVDAASQLAERINDTHAFGWTVAARALIAFGETELEQTVELVDEATLMLRERAEDTFRIIGSLEVWFALHALFLKGDLAAFMKRGPACAREAESRGDRYTLSTVRAYVLPLHWAVLDRPSEARREADAAVQDWPEASFYHQHWARLRAQCFLDLYESIGENALARTTELRPRMKRAMQLRIRTPRMEFNYLQGRGALEAKRRDGGARSYDELIRKKIAELRGEQNQLASVYAGMLEAGLTSFVGLECGGQAYGRASEAFFALSMPLHRFACDYRQAECSADDVAKRKALSGLKRAGAKDPVRFIDMLAPKLPLHQGAVS